MTEKSQVADIDRSIYDIRDAEHDAYRMEAGLTPAIVEKLSKEKNDPAWMEQFRLESLQIYNNMRVPDWGPSLEGLDIDPAGTYLDGTAGGAGHSRQIALRLDAAKGGRLISLDQDPDAVQTARARLEALRKYGAETVLIPAAQGAADAGAAGERHIALGAETSCQNNDLHKANLDSANRQDNIPIDN